MATLTSSIEGLNFKMCIIFCRNNLSITQNVYTKGLPHTRYIRRHKNVTDHKEPTS